MPSRRPQPEPTFSIYPHQVHIGDRFTDADTDGVTEWEVVSRPVTFKKGHEVRARVQRPGKSPATERAHSPLPGLLQCFGPSVPTALARVAKDSLSMSFHIEADPRHRHAAPLAQCQPSA